MIFLDRLIYMIDGISAVEYGRFNDLLELLELKGLTYPVKRRIGQLASRYHYEMTVGEGEGAMFIGWQHNKSKPVSVRGVNTWSMKVEYNPVKVDKHLEVICLLQECFEDRSKRVTTLDLAHDIELDSASIVVIPTAGREENRYRGDRYFGNKGKHGYLKVYDKKRERKEKAKIEIEQAALTRIEYTVKFQDGISIAMLPTITEIELVDEYDIRVFDESVLEGVKAEIKACVLAIWGGQMQLKDFTRTTQGHIKRVLEQCQELALGTLIQDSWKDVSDTILRYIVKYYSLQESIA